MSDKLHGTRVEERKLVLHVKIDHLPFSDVINIDFDEKLKRTANSLTY
jgi:hypothetical protein